MLIKALCDYYDVLFRQGKILSTALEKVNISYLISLTTDGRVAGIRCCREKEKVPNKKGIEKEKDVPVAMILPRRISKSGVTNIIEHRPEYIFGLSYGKDGDFCSKCNEKNHQTFVRENRRFLDMISDPSPVMNAYRMFMETWEPEDEIRNRFLLDIGKEIKTSYFAFELDGKLLHEDPDVIKTWEAVCDSFYDNSGGIGQCSVSGKLGNIPLTHDRIKGVIGAQARCSLVSYNNDSETSYGQEQGKNSCITEDVMHKYVAAINYLLDGWSHKEMIGDITVLVWSADADEEKENAVMGFLRGVMVSDEENPVEQLLYRINNGESVDVPFKGVDIYILGLRSNGGRIATVFFYKNDFPAFFKNVIKYHADMQVMQEYKPVSVYAVQNALTDGGGKLNIPIYSGIQRAMLLGTKFPAGMVNTILRMIDADMGKVTANEQGLKKNAISLARMGVLKAYMRRNYEEDVKVGLDRENKNKAYLSGRILAVATEVQNYATKKKLNRTLADRFFRQARCYPASTIPKIWDSYTYYIKKVEHPEFYQSEVKEITDLMESRYPEGIQRPEDQIQFVAGYFDECNEVFQRMAQAGKKKAVEDME